MIVDIVTEYTSNGAGKKIFIFRSNGLMREYPYNWKNEIYLMILTTNWRTTYFPNSIMLSRY